MNIAKTFKDLKAQKGLYQFIIRSIFFFGIILAVYLAIFLWGRYWPFFIQYLKIGDDFYIPWLTGLQKTDFLDAVAFAIIAFCIWNRDAIRKFKPTTRHVIETVSFAILAIVSFSAHYLLKFWVTQNLALATNHAIAITILKYLLLVMFVIFTATACYTASFLNQFFRKLWKPIGAFALVGLFYFFLIQVFQVIWYSLSYFVSQAVRFLLSLTFSSVYFSPGSFTTGPTLGAAGFYVGISDACSGIDSLLLFISLYVLLLALDWKRMHLSRMFILFIPGIIGTIAYNILRIYLLLLVGIFYSPTFAVDTFHTNIGWILFLVFFLIFWNYGSKWVYKKKLAKA